jgi:hypothetical protein
MSRTSLQQTLLRTPSDTIWSFLALDLEQPNRKFLIPPSSPPLESTQTACFATNNISTYTFRPLEDSGHLNAHYDGMTRDPPKLRCWQHNCNGRTFSSLGNYRRHLREKSGIARTFLCQDCGRGFTRSTALNSHRQRCPVLKSILDMLSCVTSPSHPQSFTGSTSSWSQWSNSPLPLDYNLDLMAVAEETPQVIPHETRLLL